MDKIKDELLKMYVTARGYQNDIEQQIYDDSVECNRIEKEDIKKFQELLDKLGG